MQACIHTSMFMLTHAQHVLHAIGRARAPTYVPALVCPSNLPSYIYTYICSLSHLLLVTAVEARVENKVMKAHFNAHQRVV